MSEPVKLNFKIYQGATFEEVLRWESSVKTYSPITGISNTAPVVVTSVGHGLPEGWRARITNTVGMKEINNLDYLPVSNVTADTVEFNAINAIGYSIYQSGGVLEYNTPVDLTGYTGRMQIRKKLADPEILLELTTVNGGIIVDNTSKTITINITAEQTKDLTFGSGVYSLELVSDTGKVIRFIEGTVTVQQEVTR